MKLEVMGAGCVCSDGDANDYIAIDDDTEDCHLALWGPNDKENRKLAHLFAAAPELYEALKNLLQEDISQGATETEAVIIAARAALAKVESPE